MKKKAYYIKPLTAIVLPEMEGLLQEDAGHVSIEKLEDPNEGAEQWGKQSGEVWEDDYFSKEDDDETPASSLFGDWAV